ncbi:MAG: DNA replication/repair protein RecF [Bacilli bacterium]
MYVKKLTLINFRNYKNKTFEFDKSLNVIFGPNGVGKTNVVEAIYYLSLARSFRTIENIELIKEGEKEAYIFAEIYEGNILRRIKVIINKEGRKILINNKPIQKISELSRLTNVVLFEPKDVMLFRGSPSNRRKFLDIALSKQSQGYFDAISRYEKVLKERNELLKREKVDPIYLSTLTELLVKLSKPIIKYRTMYCKDINNILIKITRALTGVCEDMRIEYHPYTNIDDENYLENTLLMFERNKEGDLKRKATSIGIQREDFVFYKNNKDISKFGSQGENRICALALKLAPYFLIKEQDKKPIVVLDDVLSELDEDKKSLLISFVKKFEQAFITTVDNEVKDATTFKIANN